MAPELVGGRYRLETRIAFGGMAEVWAAHDLELDRPVALKLLARDADPARFDREARAVAGLSHPNICQLYDFGETEGRPYMVLERVDGGTLEDRLQGGDALPDEETERVAGELAAALAYAHEHGVLHRDVKPANVLFDADGTTKLADFGIARLVGTSTLTEAGTLLGTAAYLSPEQAAGQTVTPATDVYAFGVILYRMLTGRLPYEAESPFELARMHAAADPEPIPSLRRDAPRELSSVAMSALHKRPEERPPDGSALVAALASPAQGEVTQETLALPAPVRRRLNGRHVATGSGLVLVAAAGAAAAVLLTAPETSKAPVTRSEPRPAGHASTDAGATRPSSSTTRPATTRTRRQTTERTSTASTSTSRNTVPATTATTQPATTAATTTTEPGTTTEPPTTTATTETTPTTTATTTTTP